MNIYIDESGSFVNAQNLGAWNVVAGYVIPETDSEKLEECLRKLKRNSGYTHNDELKLKQIDEDSYLTFTQELSKLSGVVFCCATDAGENGNGVISEHQITQSKLMLKHIDKMQYQSGREGVQFVSSQVGKLSQQLYVQLICQLNLMFEIVTKAIPYFVQRAPTSLKNFSWKVDQKNTTRNDFEDAFMKLGPAFLQTKSLSEPIDMIREWDYGCLKDYMYEKGQAPTYLKDFYDFDVDEGLDVQKIIRKDLEFVESKYLVGVQVVDLIASGIRRCMRREFANNEKAALHLGRLLVQAKDNRSPIKLLSFSTEKKLNRETAKLITIMIASCKPMINAN